MTKMTAAVNSYRLNPPNISRKAIREIEVQVVVFFKSADVVVMVLLCNVIMTIAVALTGA